MNLHRTAFVLFVSMLLGLPITGQALDTDVYLNAQGVSRDDSPNVLIILDNSGSMTTVVTSRPAYDPNINYATQPGAPSTPFDSTRIYWATSSSPPTSTTTNKWFSVSNNKCTASVTVLASGGTGIYANDTVVGWANKTSSTYPPGSSTQGSWANLSGGRDSVVECKADNPADASLGTYAASGQIQYQNRYTSSSGSKLNWSSFNTTTLYNANYLNYFNNATLSSSDTRMNIAKDAIKSIIDSNQNVRFGLMVFNTNSSSDSSNSGNHGGRVIFKVDTMTPARRTAMKTVVDGVTATTWTPLTETMWEARQYLGGLPVDYGDNDSSASPGRDTTAESSGTYASPLLYSCQKAYIILVTDGDPTNDNNADTKISALSGIGTLNGSYLDELTAWMSKNDIYAGKAGVQSAVTYTVGFGSGISASGLQLLKDAASKSGGKYFAANDADQLNAALQGTLIEVLQTTTSFAAPALSVNAFNTLFNRDEVYFAVFKPSNSILWNGNIKKYTLCKDKSASATCTFGEIIDRNGAPAVDPTSLRIKDSASSYWGSTVDGNIVASGGAGARIPLPAPTTRKVYTYTGAYDTDGRTPTGTVSLTSAVNAVDDTNTALTTALLNVSTASERTNLINWILGMDVYDANSNGDTTEPRWALSDPTHSRPVAVTYGGTNAAPIVKLFVGTNDGMLRMINENNGQEEWSFLPQELLGIQNTLSLDNNGLHLWGMDGTPTFQIQDKSKNSSNVVVDLPDGIIDPSIGDFVHVIIGMRRGGNNYYALDVTPTAKLTSASSVGGVAPKLLWVIRGGASGTAGYGALGQTWSKPSVAKIRYGSGVGSGADAESASKTVLIFGGGYDPSQDNVIPVPSAGSGNAIYIADVDTGERLWWASGAASGANLQLTGMVYSIPSDLALMDANGDGNIDRIYVGDVSGQVWRVDLSPTLRKNNGDGTTGSRFADLGCEGGTRPACTSTTLQDRRKFYYPPNIAQVNDSIFEATQPKYDIVTLSSGDREDPLDNLTFLQVPAQDPVHNRIYALRDYRIDALSTGGSITYNATLTESDLYDATSNTLQGATSTAIASSGIMNKKGWFIDLQSSSTPAWEGEKGLARTVIFGGTLFATTYVPANATTATLTCAANEGIGHLYALNILDATADIDFDQSGTLTTTDRFATSGGGIPSELVTVIREGGVTGLVGPNQPAGIRSTLPREKTYWFQ
jgi:type IV pilus assembly protein PilY1